MQIYFSDPTNEFTDPGLGRWVLYIRNYPSLSFLFWLVLSGITHTWPYSLLKHYLLK